MYRSAIAILIAISIGSVAHAQQRKVRDMIADMKARYGQTFEQCQALATSRGYLLIAEDDEGGESRAVMMFIEGCIMGKQR
jgi:hypothetical protein